MIPTDFAYLQTPYLQIPTNRFNDDRPLGTGSGDSKRQQGTGMHSGLRRKTRDRRDAHAGSVGHRRLHTGSSPAARLAPQGPRPGRCQCRDSVSSAGGYGCDRTRRRRLVLREGEGGRDTERNVICASGSGRG
jgi:hypothetical protein